MAMGDEQHPWMDAGGSSGHGGPGEREAPIAICGKTISLKWEIDKWVDDGIRTRDDWYHKPGLYR